MRSVCDLFNLVQDGKVKTAKQGKAIIEEEVQERMTVMEQSTGRPQDEAETRAILKSNIGYNTGYADHALADLVMKVYDCEHPIFGKTHPSAEEALRLGIEYGKRSLEKRKND